MWDMRVIAIFKNVVVNQGAGGWLSCMVRIGGAGLGVYRAPPSGLPR
jgi:hypothetical protein